MEDEDFPLHAKVTLQGLVKAPELNGQHGTVQSSGMTDGRYTVLLSNDDQQVVRLRASTMQWRNNIDPTSLSTKELKAILLHQQQDKENKFFQGAMDKSELVSHVQALQLSGPDLAKQLCRAQHGVSTNNASTATASSSNSNKVNVNQAHQAAAQLADMSPAQLRQQAQAMKQMDPATLRRMNPQFAHMSNAQIQMAAQQMEMMASNPHMMKMATEQMKNMSPEQLEQSLQQQGGGTSGATTNTTPTSPQDQQQQAMDAMANMSPEQMQQQATMLKQMDPATVRSMNPQMAHLTDAQIKMAATQMEMMAGNPDMVKMAMNQMNNMTPEQLRQFQQAGGGAAGGTTGNTPMDPMAGMGDPSQLLANMDKTQLKSMLSSLKDNPDMLKQFAAGSGMSVTQLQQGVDLFANMDDTKLEAALSVMGKAQKAKETWSKVDQKVGGHLWKLCLVGLVVLGYAFLSLVLFRKSGGANATVTLDDTVSSAQAEPVVQQVQDEFDL